MKRQNDRNILIQKHLVYYDDDTKFNKLNIPATPDSVISSH